MNESLRLVSVAETITTYDVTIGGDTNHLYPCTWGNSDGLPNTLSIRSGGSSSESPFNTNILDVTTNIQGWSDSPKFTAVHTSVQYSGTEITIHSIWTDLKDGYGAIYLRGGLSYRISSNYRLDCSPTAKTYNGCTFGIMNADFSVTGAVLVDKLWTYTEGRTDARLDDFGTWARSAVKPAYTAAEVGAAPVVHNHDGVYCFNRTRTNYNDNTVVNNVVGELAWRKYGNNHTIFDASSETRPDGVACNSINPEIQWLAAYPTLMGFNGIQTYGVRVDSARQADNSVLVGGISTKELCKAKTSVGIGGNNNDISTPNFIELLKTYGAFDTNYFVIRGSWHFVMCNIISDTGIGKIQLAGSVIEVFNDGAPAYTIRITTPSYSTGAGEKNRTFIYCNNGASYSPGWTKLARADELTADRVGAINAQGDKFITAIDNNERRILIKSPNNIYNAAFGTKDEYTYMWNNDGKYLKIWNSGRLTFNEKDIVLTDDPRLSNARPASDVSAWAKAATKPTTYFTELLTDVFGSLVSGSIKRHPLLKSSTSAGYIQRIAIGLKRPVVEGWGRGLFSVGTNDSGTTFADYEFDIGGRIYSPAGTFALLSEISWANLLNKPSCFTPCAHGHAWSEISGKPTTFAPTAHTHAMGDITGLSLDWSSITNKPNALSALNSRLILTPGNNEAGLILNRAGGGFLGIGNGGTSINKFGTCDANGSWIASTDAWKIYGTSLLFNDLAVCLTASPYAEASVNYLRFNFAMDGIEARNVLLNYMIKSTPTIAKYVFYAGNADLAGITCSTIQSSTITSEDRVNAVNGFFQTSDKRIKSDIKSIELKSKEILLREYIRTDSKQHEYGIVALEIEEIYPEVVNTDKDGMKSVNYILALVIKCAELDLKITLQDKKILELENKLNILLKKFA